MSTPFLIFSLGSSMIVLKKDNMIVLKKDKVRL